jgi:hypothetical protein
MCLKSCLILEVSKPSVESCLNAIEDFPISNLPKLPGRNQKNLHEKGQARLLPGSLNHHVQVINSDQLISSLSQQALAN